MHFYKSLINTIKKKQCILAVLIDPDKFNKEVVLLANSVAAVYFVGGSTLKKGELDKVIKKIRKISALPIIIFPGDSHQIDANADAILLPTLISGKNPDYLITKQIEMAHIIKQKNLEAIPTAYLLIEGERQSTTQKITKTKPLPISETDVIVKTVIAGEMLGNKLIYLEAGSGAKSCVPVNIIKKVRKNITIPIVIGGGIDSYTKAKNIKMAGANIIVIGNALEKNPALLNELKVLFS